jgi:hypothetical protein
MIRLFRFLFIMLLMLELVSCTAPSFYNKTYNFNRDIATKNFEAAEKLLDDNKDKYENSKVRFLYFVNGGMLSHLKGDFEKSNSYFEKADLFVEDEKKKLGEEASALFINPNTSTYRGETHEILLINYYKALNYYMLGNNEDALVEVRRLNLRLQTLSEKYKSDNKYDQDAYMHLVMGLIYDVNKNYNDAFIAYRNAYDIYENEFLATFQLGAPEQLKHDILRTANLSGMREEQLSFEKKFGFKYSPYTADANVVVLWHNGMGPVKEEWGINFAIIYTGNGWVNFVSQEYGLSFPFYLGGVDLNGLTWIKVVFPRYVERKTVYNSAVIKTIEGEFPLQMAEDINAISFKVLNQRMDAEFGKSLLRVAIKQAAAYKIGQSQDSEVLGVALSILASASESADTRNWQTLPRNISYVRVPFSEGRQDVSIILKGGPGGNETHTQEVNFKKGQTLIYPFYSLGALEPNLTHPPVRETE